MAEPVQVSVSLPLSVDIPLPYQVVRGEQVELSGSVYNQHVDGVSVRSAHLATPPVIPHNPNVTYMTAVCLHSTA